jgi:excisionase family DNA binding protein
MKQKIMDDTDLRLYNISNACKLLNIGHDSIYKQIRRRNLKTVKIGRRRLVSNRAINEFINSMEY